MATSVVMPALELAQETGKLVAWKKRQGDSVVKGEPLLEIETDKAVVEVDSPGDGILTDITAEIGDEIPVGRTIAWLVAPGESVPAAEATAASGRTADRPGGQPATRAAVSPASGRAAAAGVRLSPKARRLAQEHNVDLSQIPGTGPGGEILATDIQTYIDARATATAPAAAPVEPVSTIWKLMAERTSRSWSTVPHFFLMRDVDASALVTRRAPLKEKGVTYTDFLIALVARVLARHPRINASWTPDGIRLNDDINVGVAVASDEGVVVPVVRNAATSSVATIAAERQAVTDRARAGRARPADLSGATFTISNLGTHHVDAFTAVINPPQAAILAAGSITDRVVAIDGRPVVRPMLTMTLSSDHRVIDGARAAAFMDDLATAIANPEGCL